jgi:lambda repressor-like predicted transcriptional regulator
MPKKPKPKPSLQGRVAELEDQLKERDERITDLRRELNEAELLISEEREYVESARAVIDSWKEAFGMVQDDKGVWQLDKWVENHKNAIAAYEALAKDWNRFVPEYNALMLKRIERNIGRPLAANEGQIAQVRKLRKAGRSLRAIAAEIELSLATVRTILDRDDGSDRMTKKRWQKLHPGEKWKERTYTPVGALERIDAKRFREEPWRLRTRASIPKRIGETLERGRELVKAAKGLR